MVNLEKMLRALVIVPLSVMKVETALEEVNRVTREHYRCRHPILFKRMQVPVSSETMWLMMIAINRSRNLTTLQ